jgi:hypothetical protein
VLAARIYVGHSDVEFVNLSVFFHMRISMQNDARSQHVQAHVKIYRNLTHELWRQSTTNIVCRVQDVVDHVYLLSARITVVCDLS